MNERSVTPDFELLETLRWRPESGYFLLDRHLARLSRSAAHFAFGFDAAAVQAALAAAVAAATGPLRVRLTLAADGRCGVTCRPLPAPAVWRVGLARAPVDAANPFLRHKTTRREVYAEALAACPGLDDVVLYNARGEVTEATQANVILDRDGARLTPPLECGLLPGTMRAALLDVGAIRESRLTVADLRAAGGALHLVNSVREWIPVEFVTG